MKRLAKGIIILPLLLFILAVSAWSYDDGIAIGPYELVYPASFGNRINTLPDKPAYQAKMFYLGRMLFYETSLSANNTISCGTCHQQDKAFTDGKAFSEGVDHVLSTRNSMSLANVLWTRKFFWDGRVTGLEEQAIVPMTNPHEMGAIVGNFQPKKLSQTDTYPALFKVVYGDEKHHR